ncbi:hypothetical protein QJS66_14245 [Kocuria rhizophila]|nr:hypothetical protein QJS66_14245 [Kocuria rhizophila]
MMLAVLATRAATPPWPDHGGFRRVRGPPGGGAPGDPDHGRPAPVPEGHRLRAAVGRVRVGLRSTATTAHGLGPVARAVQRDARSTCSPPADAWAPPAAASHRKPPWRRGRWPVRPAEHGAGPGVVLLVALLSKREPSVVQPRTFLLLALYTWPGVLPDLRARGSCRSLHPCAVYLAELRAWQAADPPHRATGAPSLASALPCPGRGVRRAPRTCWPALRVPRVPGGRPVVGGCSRCKAAALGASAVHSPPANP